MIGNDIQDEESDQANIPAPIPVVAPTSVRRIAWSTALLVQPMSVNTLSTAQLVQPMSV